MHDHVFDVLVKRGKECTFGFENINTGLSLLQQWDEIIKYQRRTFLLAWPEFRPANLMSTWEKLIVVKWAAMFNLTIENLQSSLGI